MVTIEVVPTTIPAKGGGEGRYRLMRAIESFAIPMCSFAVALALFGVFVTLAGVDPFEAFDLMFTGAFGSWFSWQNSLQRAAPLTLTALCVALPARLGLVVIGGEGALVVGGTVAAIIGVPGNGAMPPIALDILMALAAMIAGGAWIAAAGALRHYRGVNETIASLLLTYIAIAILNHLVGGPLRDPASLNKPSTGDIGEANMLGTLPDMDVHVGLLFGVILCVIAYILMERTTFGFGARMAGGNLRAARMAGLPVGRLILCTCAFAGAAAGLAGMVEVAAVQGRANASLIAGYGYTGILVAFLARQNPLAIIPVAILLGGINASGDLLQRRLDLPDATVLVLQGILFIVILAGETMFGRLRIFQPPRPVSAFAKKEGTSS